MTDSQRPRTEAGPDPHTWTGSILEDVARHLDAHRCECVWRLAIFEKARKAEASLAAPAGLREAQSLVEEQAEDEGLWFIAETAAEAYLQQELRRLHAALEAAPRSPEPTFDPKRPWDHAYVADATDRCVTCGSTGSFAHTEAYYVRNLWPALIAASPETPEAGIGVERLALFLHANICDPRASHDATLGRCWALAAEYARLASREEGAG